MKEKETILLRHLRKNSRKSLSEISQKTKIPVSTLFEKLKNLESSVIKRHTTFIDFSKVGYNLKVGFSIKAKDKEDMEYFLMKNESINNLYSTLGTYDFFAECIFKDMKELSKFKESLTNKTMKIEETFIVDDVKKEDFEF